MRIVQLDIGGQRIEFHPYVSVLSGLDESLRAQLVDAFAGLPSGAVAAGGLLEAHGVMLDLTDDTLSLLDIAGNTSVDAVVSRAQLPGAPVSESGQGRGQLERAQREAADRVARAEADADRARIELLASREAVGEDAADSSGGPSVDAAQVELTRLAARRAELEAAAQEARDEHARTQEVQAASEERVVRARALRTEAARACTLAAGALEAARAVRDPFAVASLEAARERLAKLEATPEGDAGPSEAVEFEFDDPAAEVERLQSRQIELEASLLALDTVDPYPVQSALAQLESTDDDGDLVASDEAVAMADELARIDQSLGTDLPSDNGGNAIIAARRRVDNARAALFEAERAVRLPEVDREDVEELENAHEQVLLAQDRVDKRLAGGKAKQRLDEARSKEDEILNRLGFVTYTEFVMGTSIVNVDPESESRLDAARDELAAAEDALAELEAGVDAELARAALVARRRELVTSAVAMLGRDPGDDIEWSLRHHRVRVKDSTDRAGRLLEALENAGMVLGNEVVPPALLVEMAHIWLDELAETGARRAALEAELQETEARLVRARDELRIQSDSPSMEEAEEAAKARATRRQAQFDEARAAVQAAEQRVERQNQIEADVAARRAELEEATRAEEGVASALAEAEVAATAAADAEHAAAAERARRDAELDAVIAAEEQANEVLRRFSERLAQPMTEDASASLEQSVVDAEAQWAKANAAVDAARAELERIGHELSSDEGDTSDSTTIGLAGIDEIEWYLLSRVAAQRSVSYAGSVPLLVDHALDELHGDDLRHLLSRLERMSAAVQVIVVSESPEVAGWAESVGSERASTLVPVRA